MWQYMGWMERGGIPWIVSTISDIMCVYRLDTMCWNVCRRVTSQTVSLFSGWLLTWWMEGGSDRQRRGSMVSRVPATKSWLLYLYPSSSSSCLFSSGDRHSRRMHASLHPAGQRVHVRETPLCRFCRLFVVSQSRAVDVDTVLQDAWISYKQTCAQNHSHVH